MDREWLDSEDTRRLIKDIQDNIQEGLERWADGEFVLETVDATIQKNAVALGRIQGLRAVLDAIQEEG